MLLSVARALCIALSFQSLTSVVQPHPLPQDTGSCLQPECETDLLSRQAGSTAFTGDLGAVWHDKRLVSIVVLNDTDRHNEIRAVPIIKPTPPKDPLTPVTGPVSPEPVVPEPETPNPPKSVFPETDPVEPAAPEVPPTTPPKSVFPDPEPVEDPATAISPFRAFDGVQREDDPAVIAKFCPNGLHSRRRSICGGEGLGDDSLTLGENPFLDLSEESVVSENSEPVNFFDRIQSSNPPANRAQEDYSRRVEGGAPDEEVADVAAFDRLYELTEQPIADILDISGGSKEVGRLLRNAGIEIQPAGNRIAVESKAVEDPRTHYYTLENIWSNDGKLQIVEWAGRVMDKTTTGRLPSFQISMHLAKHRTPVNDPSELEGVAHVNIVNDDTEATVTAIFAKLNPNNDGDSLVLKASAAPGTDEANAYNAFMLTDNARSTYWMLGNYHGTFNDKSVIEIYLTKALRGPDGKIKRRGTAFLRFGHLE